MFTRTLRQIALLESASLESKPTETVTEERAEPSFSQDKEVRSGDGFDESQPTGDSVPLDVKVEDRSCPDPSPCLEMGSKAPAASTLVKLKPHQQIQTQLLNNAAKS